MDYLYFKNWMAEFQVLGGGIEPPKQSPVDPEPAAGQTDAFARYYAPGSSELPPTKKKQMKKMKKR